MHKFALWAVAAVFSVSAPVLADQPTAELQALDDALPGTLINDPTRLDWQIFGADQTSKPVKGENIPGGKAATQMQFLGCIMGDYSKTAINTGIFTGKVIGVCSFTSVTRSSLSERVFSSATELANLPRGLILINKSLNISSPNITQGFH